MVLTKKRQRVHSFTFPDSLLAAGADKFSADRQLVVNYVVGRCCS